MQQHCNARPYKVLARNEGPLDWSERHRKVPSSDLQSVNIDNIRQCCRQPFDAHQSQPVSCKLCLAQLECELIRLGQAQVALQSAKFQVLLGRFWAYPHVTRLPIYRLRQSKALTLCENVRQARYQISQETHSPWNLHAWYVQSHSPQRCDKCRHLSVSVADHCWHVIWIQAAY